MTEVTADVKPNPRAKEIRFVARIKNNRLLEIREKMGLTQGEISGFLGITMLMYQEFESLTRPPINKYGKPDKYALQIADVLEVEFDYLWPDAVKAIKSNQVETKMDVRDLLAIAMPKAQMPDEKLITKDMEKAIGQLLATLTPRQEKIIRMRYGIGTDQEPMTYNEIGKAFGVGKDRIQQIERRALCFLKNPKRIKKISEYQ
jgi:transcriptional regulator with XRE-family HTH domain